MGWHFRAMSGIKAFAIDQCVTVDFPAGTSRGCNRCLPS